MLVERHATTSNLPKAHYLNQRTMELLRQHGDELAALAVFLCSPAADQVRGAAWNVDGGWIAQ